jgi:hypothetical protein
VTDRRMEIDWPLLTGLQFQVFAILPRDENRNCPGARHVHGSPSRVFKKWCVPKFRHPRGPEPLMLTISLERNILIGYLG